MSRGINKVILVGNAGKDPEVRYTQTGNAVATFSVATSERRKGADGQWTDHTEWHNIVAWGKTAETCGQYVKKGSRLYLEGRIQTRKWQEKEGNTRYTTEIVVSQLLLLDRPTARAGAEVPEDYPHPGNSGENDTSFDPDDAPF